MARYKHELGRRIEGGLLHILIFASHSDKPIMKRVPRPAKPPKEAKEGGDFTGQRA
jgi:hypothetical protein